MGIETLYNSLQLLPARWRRFSLWGILSAINSVELMIIIKSAINSVAERLLLPYC